MKKQSAIFWGILFSVIVAVLWAVLGFGLQRAYQFTDPVSVSWFRFAVASLCLLAHVFIKCRRQHKSFLHALKVPAFMYLAGVGLGLNYVAYATGVQMTTAAHSQVLSQLGPLIVLLASIVFFKERLRWKQALGVMIALAGFGLFYQQQLTHLVMNLDQFARGNLWILVGCVSWAGWAICQKQAVTQGFSTVNLNLVVYMVCAVLLLPMVNFRSFLNLESRELILLLALAANTVIAYGLLGMAMERAPTSMVQLVVLCSPVLTLLLTPERLTGMMFVATAMVITGVATSIVHIPKFWQTFRRPKIFQSKVI